MSKIQETILTIFILVAVVLGMASVLKNSEVIPIESGNIQKSLGE